MTFETKRNNRSSLAFVILLIVLLAFGGLALIFQYNDLADTRQTARNARRLMADTESAVAEVEERLYELTDPENIEAVAEAHGLVLERDPIYVNPAGFSLGKPVLVR